MKDAKKQVTTRLLELARFIRRKGSPDEAAAAIEYERQFETELAQLNRQPELALPAVPTDKEAVHA